MPETNTRARKTRASVHLWDRAAERVITLGGILVLGAVLAICIYLVYVVSPLFASGKAALTWTASAEQRPAMVGVYVDEYFQGGAHLGVDGVLRTALLENGALIDERRICPPDVNLTSFARVPGQGLSVLGLEDGSLMMADISFQSLLLTQSQFEQLAASPALAPGAAELEPGSSVAITPEAVRAYVPDAPTDAGGLLQAIQSGKDIEYRVTTLALEIGEPIHTSQGAGAASMVAVAQTPTGRALVELRADGSAMLQRVRIRQALGGETRVTVQTSPIELQASPDALYVLSTGNEVISLNDDGTASRYAPQPGASPTDPLTLVETQALVPKGRRVSASAMLNGSRTILVGDDQGEVHAWFVDKDPNSATLDFRRFIRSNTYRVSDSPITNLTASRRDRLFVAASADNRARIIHAISRKHVASIDLESPVQAWAISPKGDGLVAGQTDFMVRSWSISGAFAGASFESLFGSIHYEDSQTPTKAAYVYQSSSASDDAEAKLSLVPLIFGTLKATVFAMLFAAPIAVLAALYTSEFMQPKTRRYVKPAIELMATLPSVVLGFVAAMIVAPFVRDHLLAIILLSLVLPASVWLVATIWRSAQPANRAAESGAARTVGVVGTLVIATLATILLTPLFERSIFSPSRSDVLLMAGEVEPVEPEDIPSWVGQREALSPSEQRRLACEGMDFQFGEVVRPSEPDADLNGDGAADQGDIDAFGELQALGDAEADSNGDGRVDEEDIAHFAERVARHQLLEETIDRQHLDRAGLIRWLNGEIRSPYPGWATILAPLLILVAIIIRSRIRRPDQPSKLVGACTFLGSALIGLAIALALASVLSSACIDPRDTILGPFTQRNTLVVAIVMGVAVIPIIYTISEDALRSVPDSLRLASLGAGATPWQTAIRVVLPVAGSGVFSACMIGLGRAVGETMIVLMATGSTPEMSWNIFSGFRTLAANIAMELPEAPKGGTLYRVLFLCGLVLFVMTFAINTTAELIRQRFRKRSAAL